jgi:hypothetical protein
VLFRSRYTSPCDAYQPGVSFNSTRSLTIPPGAVQVTFDILFLADDEIGFTVNGNVLVPMQYALQSNCINVQQTYNVEAAGNNPLGIQAGGTYPVVITLQNDVINCMGMNYVFCVTYVMATPTPTRTRTPTNTPAVATASTTTTVPPTRTPTTPGYATASTTTTVPPTRTPTPTRTATVPTDYSQCWKSGDGGDSPLTWQVTGVPADSPWPSPCSLNGITASWIYPGFNQRPVTVNGNVVRYTSPCDAYQPGVSFNSTRSLTIPQIGRAHV